MIRSCFKTGHSCYRNVVSFAKLLGRVTFKAVGRALRHLTQLILPGWSVQHLLLSSDHIRKAYASLQPIASDQSCKMCSCTMLHPSCSVWDAGQAYEQISKTAAQNDLGYVPSRAEAIGNGLVQVFKGARAVMGNSHPLHRHANDGTVVASKSIRSCVDSYFDFNIYKVGNRFIQHKRAAPIGGFLSSALLGLVLAAAESRFDKLAWPDLSCSLSLPGPRLLWFTASRYEDELLCASHHFRQRCLDSLIALVYQSSAKFGLNETCAIIGPNSMSNKFLDLHVTATPCGISI